MPDVAIAQGDCPTAQQRAARITYHLVIRALNGAGGMTTPEIAEYLEMSRDGALKLMEEISNYGGVPVYDEKVGRTLRWNILVEPVRTRFSLN